MKTEGRQRGQSGDDARAQSNVLQFPRDWIGPRDELVPFGAAAGSDTRGEVKSEPKRRPEPAVPPGADDFWGEGSAAVQDALQAPRPVEAVVELSRDTSTKARHRWNRPPLRATTLISLGVAAVACVVVVLAGAASEQVANLKRAPALAHTPSLVSRSGLIPAHVIATARASRQTIRHPARPRPSHGVHARPHSAGSGTRKAHVSQAVSHRSSASAQPVRHSTPPPSTDHTTPTQDVSPAVSSSSGNGSTSVSDSGSTAGSNSSASATTSPAGPVGPGAAFGPGRLG